MAVDNKFIIKKLQRLEKIFVLFSPLTRMPYIACDEETFDDQVYLFSAEESAKKFVSDLETRKIPAAVLTFTKAQMNGFLNSLYALDVNAVIFSDETGETSVPVEDLAKRPDMEKIAKEKIPVMNPQLTLTMIYFLQELRRPVKPDPAHLRELEDEMIVNLIKSQFILGIETAEEGENISSDKIDFKNVRIPFFRSKEGDIYQPVYTDFSEFRKHTGPNAKKLRISSLAFQQLPQFFIKDSKGYVINPASMNLVLTTEQIKRILRDYEG